MVHFDCIVIGGGIIGRWIALDLAQHDLRVAILDCPRARAQASWAAAGILPPPPAGRSAAEDRLAVLSWHLYFDWADQLQAETGIDIGLRRCGALHVTRRPGEAAALHAAAGQWRTDGIVVEPIQPADLAELEPNLRVTNDQPVRCAYRMPDECQVRPPWLLRALRVALDKRGVDMREDTKAQAIALQSDSVHVTTDRGTISARKVCIAAGAWSAELLRPLRIELPVEPYRGQILQWALERPPIRHVINEGPRYLVAREDGVVLAGSTVEDVGFDDRTTREALAELEAFAADWLPVLGTVRPQRAWAGFRPGSRDGRPYLGRVPGHENLILAAGHFRSGIWLAPGTAQLIGQLVRGEATSVPIEAFGLRCARIS